MVLTPSEFVVLGIEPDTTLIENVLIRCGVFWNRFILRELVILEIESEKELLPSTLNKIMNIDILFCICKSKSFQNDTMVDCNSCDKFFHLKCLS